MKTTNFATSYYAILAKSRQGKAVSSTDIGKDAMDTLVNREVYLTDAVIRYVTAMQLANDFSKDLLETQTIKKMAGIARKWADVEVARDDIFNGLRALQSLTGLTFQLGMYDIELLTSQLIVTKTYKDSDGSITKKNLELKALATCRREIEWYIAQRHTGAIGETTVEAEARKTAERERKKEVKRMQKAFGTYVDENYPDMDHNTFVAIWNRSLPCSVPADIYTCACAWAVEWKEDRERRSIASAKTTLEAEKQST